MSKHRMCQDNIPDPMQDIDIDAVREELFEDRKILLNEPITDHILYTVFHPMQKLITLDDKLPITLYINSTGGDAYAALCIASAIMSSKTPITTICLGSAQSGAALILAAGHIRAAFRYSTIMLHLPKATSDVSTSKELASQTKGIEMLDEDIYDLLEKKTTMTKRVIKNKLISDWFLGPTEALKYGIIDTIL